MKILRRILISILIVSMIMGCVGCTKDTETVNSGLTTVKGEYLVKDGATDYKLVVPEEASSLILIATSEFNKFVSESTGVQLPVITDKEVKAEDKYISIGETTVLQETDITYEYDELGRDGYKIITEGENLYLIGGADYGSLYATYELLEYLIDYKFFAKDCYRINQGVTQIPLYEFDLTDIPDIALRMASDGVIEGDNSTLYRMRVRPYIENFLTVNGYWAHNSFAYVQDSPDVNAKWYNQNQKQLCYTAHGDEIEYEKMLNACLITMKEALMENTERESITFTIEDNPETCNCDACQAMVEKYGALSSTIILFLNDLNALIRDWFETEEGKTYSRDLRIVFFAYNGYEAAPATYNEKTGKYEANAGIKLDEGVYCQLAPIRMDYYRPITDESNIESYNNLRAWGDIVGGNLYLWYYSTNFNYYLAPYDCFDSFVENYRMAVDCDTYYIFNQRQTDERGVVTGWSDLKTYICNQLAWDADQDVEELINEFFEGCYGPAASDMREIFDQLRLLTTYNKEHQELGGVSTIYLKLDDEKFWPKDVLEQWLEKYESAEEKISVYEEKSPEMYAKYLDNIHREKLSVLYLLVECYSYNTSADIIDSYKTEFKEIADKFNITRVDESDSIENLYEKWGLN